MQITVRCTVRAKRLFMALAISTLMGCITNPPATSAGPGFQQVVTQLADDIIRQANPTVVQRMLTRRIVLDPFLDAQSGQQTIASQQAAAWFARHLQQQHSNLKLEKFDAQGVDAADYLIAGTLRKSKPGDNFYTISATLTERRTGLIIASAVGRVQEHDVDNTPTAFYADSPSVVTDRLTDGYIRTSEAPSGSAADPSYLASLSTAVLVHEAHQAYEAERWNDALLRYQTVAQRPDGQQLKVFNGLYNSHLRLGDLGEAEKAFTHIVALGLATDNLAVRLLFNPGRTDFWNNSTSSQQYPMWLRQIAKETIAGDYCLTIVGHTSKTGSEATNERLSLARAQAVRELLLQQQRRLAQRIDVDGMGWKQTLIGSGTDDLRDALDRRVEFKTRPCP